MGMWALILAFLLYLVVSIDLFSKKNYALSLVFLCYAVSNLAYIWVGDYLRGPK